MTFSNTVFDKKYVQMNIDDLQDNLHKAFNRKLAIDAEIANISAAIEGWRELLKKAK